MMQGGTVNRDGAYPRTRGNYNFIACNVELCNVKKRRTNYYVQDEAKALNTLS